MQSKTLNKIMKSHPLAVLMILTALDRFSKAVAESDPSEYSRYGLINAEAWIQLGKDIQQELK